MAKRLTKEEQRIQAGIDENVRLGFMAKEGRNAKGEQLYRLTKKGKAHVEAMMARPARSPGADPVKEGRK